ncbi:conserved protein of unknown function [Methylorubrum extorquens]|uniref:Uncharacterized protein n=1 Tax=Methylorubrum extorquens TaxID=408 RepID=A0A2N9AMF2_METEX|nr:conserved protein of unknown function [Methylorubrum extorquens]
MGRPKPRAGQARGGRRGRAGHALQGPASRSRIAEICPAKISPASRARFQRPSEGEERSHFEWAGRRRYGLSEGGRETSGAKKGAPFEGAPFLIWLACLRCAARLAAGSSVLPQDA